MDTIKVNIDTVQFTSKPKGFAVGSIRNRLYSLERVEEITPEALAQRICQGVTWTQAVMAGTTKKDWREQWTICADLDNKGESKLSPEDYAYYHVTRDVASGEIQCDPIGKIV